MIALVDCNNFYASCERVFQPELMGKPLVILSNNDGCAIARSEEAKALGIQMGTPAFMIKDLIKTHNVQVRSSNYTLYGDMSERVMNTIRTFVPKVEEYSIDEIFCDLTELKYADLKELGQRIKKCVTQSTGIPVSIGIAATKTLAKMANRYAKKKQQKTGVYCADTEDAVHRMLQHTNVGAIWNIGKQHEQFLLLNGFQTAADLLQAPEEWIRKNLSVKGQRLLNELKGIPCLVWEEKPPPKKNICTARSFGRLITTKRELQQAVATHTASCGSKLRSEGSCAQKLHVFIQTNIHRAVDKQYFQSITLELPVATNSTKELIHYAMKGLGAIFKEGYNYQKAGVMVLDLVPQETTQMGLFDTEDRKKDKVLMQTLDSVNKAFGKDAVRFGVQGYGKAWKLKQEKLSPCFTTRIDSLMKVSAY
jgi:DNA polymerase V